MKKVKKSEKEVKKRSEKNFAVKKVKSQGGGWGTNKLNNTLLYIDKTVNCCVSVV